MKKYIIAMILVVMCFTACHKDAQIEPKTPVITAQTAEPLATEAYFTWTVDFPGKMSSVVKIGRKADMSDAVSYGDDTLTSQKEYFAIATGLTKTTTYYYCYEVWNPGMSFQSEVYSFTTLDEGLAMVTTTAVTDISSFSAKCGGNVTYDGNHTVTERGVCWSTSHNPNISGSHASSGSGTGSFTCSITNLEPETQYYVRAYATNSVGTNYGSEVSFTTVACPIGAINGLFTVNSNGDQVYFSQGNLQYQASTTTWKFAENQYDRIGEDNSNISSSYNGWIDLFGWGTSGWNNGNVYYEPWSSANYEESGHGRLYGPYGQYSLTGNYSNSDWGVYNAISNGGNQSGLWRTLSYGEWKFVIEKRQTASGKLFAKAQINGINGLILLPDHWQNSIYDLNNANDGQASFNSNIISLTQWSSMESVGAVFLPVTGSRVGTEINESSSDRGYYHSSSYHVSNCTHIITFYDSKLYPDNVGQRHAGWDVRLVYPVNSFAIRDLPDVYCSNVTNITSTSATATAYITGDGGLAVTERGFCWCVHNSIGGLVYPTINDNHIASSTTGTGSYTVDITGLTAGIEYYIQPYAINEQGVSYGPGQFVYTNSN
ncbi:MAG: hypothetical protein J6P73_07860 [Bacteroidales bacterium]|nr:hypothetical protein [Bacteroidales bacterium]